MPFFGWNSASNNFRYRIFFIFISILFLYFYFDIRTSYKLELEKKDIEVLEYKEEAISLSEKLKIIWSHKQQIEASFREQEKELIFTRKQIEQNNQIINGLNRTIQKCESTVKNCKMEQQIVKTTNLPEEEMEKNQLKKRIEELENELKKSRINFEEKIENFKNLADKLKNELEACEETIKKSAGSEGIDQYTRNETAHFQRQHKANEPLSFDRGNIEHHAPVKLLRGKELAEMIDRMRNEDEVNQQHPQDRELKEEEAPDKHEEDYKEH